MARYRYSVHIMYKTYLIREIHVCANNVSGVTWQSTRSY